jgi:hypothetical protein
MMQFCFIERGVALLLLLNQHAMLMAAKQADSTSYYFII